jgi:hypothetical protein
MWGWMGRVLPPVVPWKLHSIGRWTSMSQLLLDMIWYLICNIWNNQSGHGVAIHGRSQSHPWFWSGASLDSWLRTRMQHGKSDCHRSWRMLREHSKKSLHTLRDLPMSPSVGWLTEGWLFGNQTWEWKSPISSHF